jgi:hypothetical protein
MLAAIEVEEMLPTAVPAAVGAVVWVTVDSHRL